MRKFHFLIILLFCWTTLYSQDFSYKDKKYDVDIYFYIYDNIELDSITLDEYLEFSKPFSKWDMRPLATDQVWAIDKIYSSSVLPNFYWGSFSLYYELTEEEALQKPDNFLFAGIRMESELTHFYNQHQQDFAKLVKLLQNSTETIYLNQGHLQRVDEIYFENGEYWMYELPEDSPFPISDKTKQVTNTSYSTQQFKIVELIKDLNLYAVYKDGDNIYFLVDGFTDNSYGFYYNSEDKIYNSTYLFEIMKEKQLDSNFYYFVAN